MVVGDLGVVDDAAERQHVEPGHVGGRLGVLVVAADAGGRRLDLADHVGGEEARVRARVGQRLVLLVEALGGGERAAGREAVAVVGLALQRGQVVEERRALLLRRRLELRDLAGLALDGGDDRLGLGGGARGAAWRRRGSDPRRRGPSGARLRLELRVDEPVLLGLELADLDLAARRGSPASASARGRARRRRRTRSAAGSWRRAWRSCRRSSRPPSASGRPPRGGRTPRPGRRSPNACLIAALVIEDSHSRWTGFLASGLLVQPGEDQLALAAGVAGVDDRRRCPCARARLVMTVICLRERSSRTTSRKRVRHDRQVGHPPLLVLRVVLVGLGELHEVADRPRDDVAVGLEVALVLGERAGEHAREVAPHGGLLGDDERLGHWSQTSGRLSGRRDLWRPASRAPARTCLTTEFGTPYPPRGPFVVAAKIVATTRPRPSTIGPPELPERTTPRSEAMRRCTGPRP